MCCSLACVAPAPVDPFVKGYMSHKGPAATREFETHLCPGAQLLEVETLFPLWNNMLLPSHRNISFAVFLGGLFICLFLFVGYYDFAMGHF